MTDAQACQTLLDRLASGASVEAIDIYKCLDRDNCVLLKQRLGELREQRKWFEEAKRELREYTELLHIADLMNGRAERLSSSANRRLHARVMAGKPLKMEGHSRLHNKAESKYEEALERLSELLADRQDLASFLDRDFSWSTKLGQETVSPDKESMPRLRFPFENATQVKISVLQSVLDQSIVPTSVADDNDTIKSLLMELKAGNG